ncbi:MAG: class I SAM-dependent methyltransferase [Candidatus Bathyarchaeia archaeon]
MRVKYGWNPKYPYPDYWNIRTPLFISMPKLFLLYQDLNDKKLRAFLRKLKGNILDAGCGDGRFVAYANVAVDFSKGMLKRARRRHPDRNFVRASILNFPFRDKSFSAVFTVDVLLHVQPDRRKDALREMDRVADNSYNFLGEHRTIVPFVLELLSAIPLKRLGLVIPYAAIFFAFPFDRLKRLKIDGTSQVLGKLTV